MAMLQARALRNTVVESPTMAPVSVARTNHLKTLANMIDSSVSLCLMGRDYSAGPERCPVARWE